jgi:tRNA threonylcarbamoyladenosine biosynthesis protein TsaB
MILFINTSNYNDLHFALLQKSELKEFKATIAFNENYKTNELLEKFLSKSKVKPKNLTKIIVCSGPGSFTGIRVGVSLAQALAFALSIPLVTIPRSKLPKNLKTLSTLKANTETTINYGQAPNINKSKK